MKAAASTGHGKVCLLSPLSHTCWDSHPRRANSSWTADLHPVLLAAPELAGADWQSRAVFFTIGLPRMRCAYDSCSSPVMAATNCPSLMGDLPRSCSGVGGSPAVRCVPFVRDCPRMQPSLPSYRTSPRTRPHLLSRSSRRGRVFLAPREQRSTAAGYTSLHPGRSTAASRFLGHRQDKARLAILHFKVLANVLQRLSHTSLLLLSQQLQSGYVPWLFHMLDCQDSQRGQGRVTKKYSSCLHQTGAFFQAGPCPRIEAEEISWFRNPPRQVPP